ncbi:hypothetical protein [Paratractidigestivibacter sp.]|uniref:hypothetical protein n=1 Tax=Paratractidigestivibacter sp. TaxID=2847316 RepID=UPI002AC94543|nr:hypothetical protein [Paratractidigestivibacter sp.]
MDPVAQYGTPDVNRLLESLDYGYDPGLMQDTAMRYAKDNALDENNPYDAADILSHMSGLFEKDPKGPASAFFASPRVSSQEYIADLADTTYNPANLNDSEHLHELADDFGLGSRAADRTPLRVLLGDLPDALPDNVPVGYQSSRSPTGDASRYPAAQSADVMLEALYNATQAAPNDMSPYEALAYGVPKKNHSTLDDLYSQVRKANRRGAPVSKYLKGNARELYRTIYPEDMYDALGPVELDDPSDA